MLEQNLSERIKQFKKIDAHSHVGYFGSWCDVGITPEELIAQMDEYNVEKSVTVRIRSRTAWMRWTSTRIVLSEQHGSTRWIPIVWTS